jgi:hypothetical protein
MKRLTLMVITATNQYQTIKRQCNWGRRYYLHMTEELRRYDRHFELQPFKPRIACRKRIHRSSTLPSVCRSARHANKAPVGPYKLAPQQIPTSIMGKVASATCQTFPPLSQARKPWTNRVPKVADARSQETWNAQPHTPTPISAFLVVKLLSRLPSSSVAAASH